MYVFRVIRRSCSRILFHRTDDCGWCKQPVTIGSPEFLATPEGPKYCSESCFTQSRRASFKRAKTCDWCKHVRHAVSYVDFQDGASQLQFCSDKCLNQYKMQIFCKETQAHLDMNPHLKEKGKTSTSALITPDLWLKSCRSPSVSPETTESSKSPILQKSPTSIMANLSTASRPIISVAPTSKLLSNTSLPYTTTLHQSDSLLQATRSYQSIGGYQPRSLRKRRSQRLCVTSRSTNLINNDEQRCSADTAINANNSHLNDSCSRSNNDIAVTLTPKTDMSTSPQTSVKITNHFDATEKNLLQQYQSISSALNTHRTNLMPLHTCSFKQSATFLEPLLTTASPNAKPLTPNIASQQALAQEMTNALGHATPPVTILVPCPIVLPIPIPIPVPLPFESFLKAAKIKIERDNIAKCSGTTESDTSAGLSPKPWATDANDNHFFNSPVIDEQPLDFTKTKSPINLNDGVHTKLNRTQHNSEHDDGCERILSDSNAELKLPKYTISRISNRKLITKELESSRPLRKRKRVVDCDFLRFKESDDATRKAA